jgi:hypothetical protein
MSPIPPSVQAVSARIEAVKRIARIVEPPLSNC